MTQVAGVRENSLFLGCSAVAPASGRPVAAQWPPVPSCISSTLRSGREPDVIARWALHFHVWPTVPIAPAKRQPASIEPSPGCDTDLACAGLYSTAYGLTQQRVLPVCLRGALPSIPALSRPGVTIGAREESLCKSSTP